MPQFDKITFLNQFFFLSIFFLFLFFFCNNFLLPKICIIFKTRAKKLNKKNSVLLAYDTELNKVSSSVYFLLDSSISASEISLSGNFADLDLYSVYFKNFLDSTFENSFENFEHKRTIANIEISKILN